MGMCACIENIILTQYVSELIEKNALHKPNTYVSSWNINDNSCDNTQLHSKRN